MNAEIFETKHREFDSVLRPVLEDWYQKKIKLSGTNPSGNKNFYQDINAYLSHIHGVYQCVKKGMNPIDVWPTLPNVEQQVLKHFESKHHKVQAAVSDVQVSIHRETPIVVIHSVHTIGEWLFKCDVHVSNEVDVWCTSMRHNTDDSSKLYKLDFNQIKKSFEQNELLEVLGGS
jgi:hypothetical protein